MPCKFLTQYFKDVKGMTDCLRSGLVVDQARKDGFRFRNVDEVSANANRSSESEEDPRVNNGVPEIGEKDNFEDPEKDKVQALVLDD